MNLMGNFTAHPWRSTICSKGCVHRFKLRRESDRKWLHRFPLRRFSPVRDRRTRSLRPTSSNSSDTLYCFAQGGAK
jgi:hypothetical protein